MNFRGHYSVIVYDLPPEREELLAVLINEFGYHKTDARIRLRHLPGILSEVFPHERATQLAVALENVGCHTSVVSVEELPDLVHAPLLHHVRCEEQGLMVLDMDGELVAVHPWSSFVFLSVGAVPRSSVEQTTRSQVVPTVTASREPLSTPMRVGELTNEMWLCCGSPEQFYRVLEHEMNYEFLGEQMSNSSSVNFKLLVQEILKHAPGLAYSASTRLFLNDQPQENFSYPSAADFRELVAGQIVVVHEVRKHEGKAS